MVLRTGGGSRRVRDGRQPVGRRPRRIRAWRVALALGSAAGCQHTTAFPSTAPPARNSGEVASAAAEASRLDVPYRIVFEWSVTEPGRRLSGGGAARIEPPGLARLDLFASNGERVAAAALDGDEIRLAGDGETELPAPALLWGSLGVYRPGGMRLMGGRQYPDGLLELRYSDGGDGEYLYTLSDDRIERIDVLRAGRASEEVQVARADGERFPERAVYRNLEAVRELTIILESVEHVESYPPEIWTLGF